MHLSVFIQERFDVGSHIIKQRKFQFLNKVEELPVRKKYSNYGFRNDKAWSISIIGAFLLQKRCVKSSEFSF